MMVFTGKKKHSVRLYMDAQCSILQTIVSFFVGCNAKLVITMLLFHKVLVAKSCW